MRAKAITLIIFCICCCGAKAQLLFKPNTAVQQALKGVLNDFPNRLQNITGTLIQENVESSDYSSTINFPGSENCTITQYRSQKNKNRSWKAVLPEVDNFAAAKKQYRELFLQVKNMSLHLPGNSKAITTKAIYDEPKEEKKFAGSIFRIGNDDELYKDVKIEVALQYMITGWQVSVYVYDKKEDDEIRPDTDAEPK
ncbi:hypothetical protein [Ferruginibacter profundus]